MDEFDRHFAKTRNIMIFAIVAKLAVIGGLIWLGAYAIKAFTS